MLHSALLAVVTFGVGAINDYEMSKLEKGWRHYFFVSLSAQGEYEMIGVGPEGKENLRVICRFRSGPGGYEADIDRTVYPRGVPKQGRVLYLANPSYAFTVIPQNEKENRWTLLEVAAKDANEDRYLAISNEAHADGKSPGIRAFNLPLWQFVKLPSIKVEAVQAFGNSGVVRLHFVNDPTAKTVGIGPFASSKSGHLLLDVNNHFVVTEEAVEWPDGKSVRTVYTYDKRFGDVQLVQSLVTTWRKQSQVIDETKVSFKYDFDTPPLNEAQVKLSAYGFHEPDGVTESRHPIGWYLVCGAIVLVGGLMAIRHSRRGQEQ